jgi:hypothetical protein
LVPVVSRVSHVSAPGGNGGGDRVGGGSVDVDGGGGGGGVEVGVEICGGGGMGQTRSPYSHTRYGALAERASNKDVLQCAALCPAETGAVLLAGEVEIEVGNRSE